MKTKILLTLTGLLAHINAHAVPTIYPTSATYLSSISNTTNSNLVADDADQRVIWVMPPSSATSTVSGLHTITANVGFCREMSDMQGFSRDLAAKMKKLRMQQADSISTIDDLNTKLSKARAEMAESVVVGKLLEISDLDNRLAEIEIQIENLNDKLSDCTQNCKTMRAQLQELRTEKLEVSKSRRTLASSRSKELNSYEKKKAVVEALKEDIEDKTESWGKLNSKLIMAKNDFISMYSAFGNMEGARAGISFKSNWRQNVDELRQANPNFDFKQILTQNAVISTNIISGETIPSGGAILGYEIPGSRSNGSITQPTYPEDLSGNVRLSLIGTCPVLHPELFDINLPNSSDEMKYGMTVSYEFPTSFVTDATATYNMHKMYQKVASSGSRGGFFSSRSWTSVEERNFFKDSFVVTWTEQDSANSLTDEQKADLEKDMRNDIFSRLAVIGLPSVASAGALATPPALSKTGSVVISDSLMKTCPGNLYCVGAAVTMDILQAIFGSSSSSSTYTNIQDMDLEERWSRSKVVYKPWISAYN